MARVTRILSLVLVLASILTVALPVSAYLYRAPVSITGRSTTSYDMLPVVWSQDNTWLASNGFMSSTAMDTRVQTLGGLNKPWMVADDRTLTAVPVTGDSQTNLFFTTGNSDATSMDVILGQGGYFTVNDAAALELGDDFSLLIEDTYIDTSVAGIIAEKPGALLITSDGNGNIRADLCQEPTIAGSSSSYTSPASNNHIVSLPADIQPNDLLVVLFTFRSTAQPAFPAGWTTLFGASDGYTYYKGAYRVASGAEGASITVTTPYSERSAHISYRITGGGTPEVSDNANGLSTQPNPPNLTPSGGNLGYLWIATCGGRDNTGGGWNVSSYPSGYENGINRSDNGTYGAAVSSASLLAIASSEEPGVFTLTAAGYWQARTIAIPPNVVSVTVADTTRRYDSIEVWADGTDLNLDLDGVTVDTVALAGVSVPDNANDWQIMSAAVPYMGSFTFEVGGATVAEYNPTSIVRGSTYDTGTVTVTNGDATVVGDATAWTSAMEGSTFISADGYYYVVDSVTDATHLELSIVYAGGTLGAQTYDMYPCLQNETTADTHVGAITWGSNPAGISVTVGGMTSSGQADIGGVSDTSTSDLLPAVGGTDWRPDPGVSPELQTNPLRPIVVAVSDNTTLSEYQVWVLLGITFVIFVTVLVGANVRGHHLITGIAASGAIILLVVWDIFPLLSLIVVVFAIWGGLVSERSPSL